ncbi:MAG: NUDIX hydrolase [Patescibacteria group bacterium]
MLKKWRKEGEPKILAEAHKKVLITQHFVSENGEEKDWTLFAGKVKGSSIVLPVTNDGNVVAIKEFKFGSGDIQLELPCGNMNDGENSLDAAERELLEETGYECEKIIPLMPDDNPLWHDTSSAVARLHPFLALGCKKAKEQSLDQGEEIEFKEIPVPEWMTKTENGEISDMKSLAVTLLAKKYLKNI